MADPGDFVQARPPVLAQHALLRGSPDPALEGHDSLVCSIVRRFPLLGYMLVNGRVYSAEEPARSSFCGEQGELCREAGPEIPGNPYKLSESRIALNPTPESRRLHSAGKN